MWFDTDRTKAAIRSSRLRALVRSVGLIIGTLTLLGVQLLCRMAHARYAARIPAIWHQFCRWLFAIDVRVHGSAATGEAVLFVANHVSYLDVPVLGSVIDVNFIAKSEIANWPVVGFLCRMQDTVFIARRAQAAGGQHKVLSERLAAGGRLVMFPEGTSSDGSRTLKFKSALFEGAKQSCNGIPVRIQPVSLAYSRLDGVQMGRWLRPLFAWYGDMTLVDHFWRFLGLGRLGVDLVFHEPMLLRDFDSRKELAAQCRRHVAKGLSDALRGRLIASGRLDVDLNAGDYHFVWLGSDAWVNLPS